MMLIDSHAHLDVPQYDGDRVEVIARARAAGVELLLEICGSDVGKGSLDGGMRLVEEHAFIYGAIGLHPHEASLYDEALEAALLDFSRRPKIIAWGEIGLDYHYDNSPRETQRRVFRRQLELALQRRLPAIIHTREADDDTIAILREGWADRDGAEIGGIIHCFTGTQSLADAALGMGFHISFSGVVTFKAAEDLREVARSVPLDRLLVETDCPYLAPIPYRGKRNEPAYVVETAKRLAELRGISLDELARVTTGNFKRLFGL
ncbi:MAG: TatD family hydrolase [Blastocatellia bacterium]